MHSHKEEVEKGMKENFVIREERSSVKPVLTGFTSIMSVISFIMLLVFLSVGLYPAFGALLSLAFWIIVGEICEKVCKQYFYCQFDVDGLKVTYEWKSDYGECLRINGKRIDCTNGKFPRDAVHPDSNKKNGPYAKANVLENHVLTFFPEGGVADPDCYILLDDVIVVEHYMVYVDKIHEILSGAPSNANQPLPVDTGVMPPFQTMSSQSNAERTVAPRTKRYSIVGQAGVFENKRFDVATTLVLGRDAAECSIAFPTDTAGVSRVHCKLVVKADGLYVYDLGSTYGTVVNNNKTISANQMMKINHGDTITIGSSQTFVVLYS